MPTIRELVTAIGEREGVEGVIVLGRDGMLVDSRTAAGLDSEHLAAHVPGLVSAAEDLATSGDRGALVTAVLEHERGMAVVSTLSTEAILLVLVKPAANVGRLLFDLRRHRGSLASVV